MRDTKDWRPERHERPTEGDEVADVQAAAVYLASEASDYVTGHNLATDGARRCGNGAGSETWGTEPSPARWLVRKGEGPHEVDEIG